MKYCKVNDSGLDELGQEISLDRRECRLYGALRVTARTLNLIKPEIKSLIFTESSLCTLTLGDQ